MIDLDNLLSKCERTVDFAAVQLRNLIEAHPDYFPMYTQNGKWMHSGEAWTNWCEGFLGGQLWLVYQATGDEYFREKAEHYSRLLEHRKTDLNVHDLGFLFFSTWKRWYDLTGEEDKNAVVIEAGQTLAKRFKEKGEYLRSFVSDESLFIDIMMNVPIIFYAAQETDDEELWETAYRHCLTTRRYLVRGDGSTSHEGIFDLGDGRVPAPDHPSGLARRLLLGARAWLVALRLRHGVRPDGGCPLPQDQPGQRLVLHGKHAERRCAAQRLGGAGVPEPARKLGRGHQRQRPDPAFATGRRSDAGQAVQRLRPPDRRYADRTGIPRHRR